jgi:hypothetical protein
MDEGLHRGAATESSAGRPEGECLDRPARPRAALRVGWAGANLSNAFSTHLALHFFFLALLFFQVARASISLRISGVSSPLPCTARLIISPRPAPAASLRPAPAASLRPASAADHAPRQQQAYAPRQQPITSPAKAAISQLRPRTGTGCNRGIYARAIALWTRNSKPVHPFFT